MMAGRAPRFELLRVPMLSDGPELDAHRDAIAELDRICLHDCPPHPGSWHMGEAPAQWWLVRENRPPRLGPRWVGYTGAYVNPHGQLCGGEHEGATCWYAPWTYLARMGVLPEARGHGLQRRMVRAAVAWAKALPPEASGQIMVSDTRANPVSANNLIAIGFRMWEPPWAWSFSDSQYWRLTW